MNGEVLIYYWQDFHAKVGVWQDDRGVTDARGQLMWVMLDILAHIRLFNPNVKFFIREC